MAAAAACQVEHRPRPRQPRRQVALHEVEVPVRLAGVAVGVELEVLLAEPFFVPGHGERMLQQR